MTRRRQPQGLDSWTDNRAERHVPFLVLVLVLVLLLVSSPTQPAGKQDLRGKVRQQTTNTAGGAAGL